jgi:hypothetical protein
MTRARIITLDIETYRTTNPAAIERIRQEAAEKEPPKTASKDVKIWWDSTKAREERFAEALDKTAVDPMLAEILCIVAAFDDEEPLLFDARDEVLETLDHVTTMGQVSMLERFTRAVERGCSEETIWVGHNVEGFDLPVLLNNFRRLRVRPPAMFPAYNAGRHYGRVFDTMKRTPGRTPYISMEAACAVVGIELPEVTWNGAAMHGGRVAECYEACAWVELLDYCKQDVLTTRELYKALTFGDQWGTYPPPNELATRLDEVEADCTLTEAQKALTQKALMKSAGAWPR